jgi:hypothetical protein
MARTASERRLRSQGGGNDVEDGIDARKRRTCAGLILCLVVVVICVVVALFASGFFDEDDDAPAGGEAPSPNVPVPSPNVPTAAAPSPALTSAPTQPLAPTPRTCNGLSNLCDVPVNEILFATMHNANADTDTVSWFPNQNQGIVAGLQAGIRGINVDIGMCTVDGAPRVSLIHGFCNLGISDPLEVFAEIQQFLTDNPHEVILMPTQIDDGADGTVRLQDVYSVFQQVVDDDGQSMADRLYAHSDLTAPWPTLAELIDSDHRILFFIYNGAETCENTECPVGFQDWFTYAVETAFEFSNVDKIKSDPEGACSLTRGGGGTRDFFGINLFVQIPNTGSSAQLNEGSFLQQHLETCSTQNSLNPNLVLVDFWNEGDILTVVQAFNEAL